MSRKRKQNKEAFGACYRKADTGSIRRILGIEPILSFKKRRKDRNVYPESFSSVYGSKIFNNTDKPRSLKSWRRGGASRIVIILFSKIILFPAIFVLSLINRILRKTISKLRKTISNTRLGYDLQRLSFEFGKKAASLKNDLINFFRLISEISISLFNFSTSLFTSLCQRIKKAFSSASDSDKKEKRKLKRLSTTVSRLKNEKLISNKAAQDLKKVIIGFTKLKEILKKQKVAVFSAAGIAIIVAVAVSTNLISYLFFPGKNINFSQAATFYWVQDDFSGGASTTAIADHSTDQTGWTYYYSEDDYLIATDTAMVYMATTTASTTETADTDFSAGTESDTEVVGSGDSAYISLDYDGSAADTSAYDFGVGAGTPIYRSVGVGGTNEIASGSATKLLTIDGSGNMSFFGTSLPNNVGVGDAIVYDSDGDDDIEADDAIVFIHGRTSNTAYTVKDEDGANTANTTIGNDTWAVYRSYTSLFNAESGTNNTSILPSYDTWTDGKDLATADQIWNIACYGDAVDTTSLYINEWDTSTTTYIRIYTPYLSSEVGVSQRHSGVWDDDKYRLEIADDTTNIINHENHTRIEGLQLEATSYVGSSYSNCISNGNSAPYDIIIYNNIMRNQNTESPSYSGVSAGQATDSVYIYNNIMYGFTYCGVYLAKPKQYVFNNTMVGCNRGIYFDGSDSSFMNNLSVFNNDDYRGAALGASSTNNAYSEGSDPGTDGVDVSAYASTSVFMDPNNNDYRLLSNSPVIGQGADLSSNPYLSFDFDIDHHARPNGAEWDIGADEYGIYLSSGNFTSQILNTSGNYAYTTITWSENVPASTTLIVKIRTSDDSGMSGATAWASCDAISSGDDISSNNCVTDGEQYFQYYIEMTTEKTFITPMFSDINVNYEKYPVTDQSVISSPYNSSDVANVVAGISWSEDETLPDGTAVTLSIRSATSSTDVLSASWIEVASSSAAGFLTDNCTKTATTVSCTIDAIPADLKDGAGEQHIQYKLTLSSTGVNTPSAGHVNLTYVVNAAPEFDTSFGAEGATAYQIATTTDDYFGQVKISYSIKDVDTTTGNVTQNYITPTLEYSTDGGENWSAISTSSDVLAYESGSSTAGNITDTNSDGNDDNQVYEDNYIIYYAYWNAGVQLSGAYATNTKIRVTINDNEAANNSAVASTTVFTVDAKDPTMGSPAIRLIASTTPADILLSATDDNSIYYELAQSNSTTTCAALLDSSYPDAYVSATTLTLAADPRTVCIRFRDDYNNTSTIQYATTPESPDSFMIQDTSNLKNEPYEYRLFLAWKTAAVPDAGFGSYHVYRSDDNSTFSRVGEVDTRTTNYYGDSDVVFDQEYWYIVTTVDSNGNESFVSETINAAANGTQDGGEGGGGDDSIAPVISNIATSSDTIYSNKAIIYWDTNEISDSVVGYSTTQGSFTSFATSTAMKDNNDNIGRHEVTIYNLSPETTYYFEVISTDPIGNSTTDDNSSDGYTLTTKSGPVISNINISNVSNDEATIEWSTDIPADSTVVYSPDSEFINSTSTNSTTLSTNHAVTVTELNQSTFYFFYVESTDAESNTTTDSNAGQYYSFITTIDSTAPSLESGPTAVVTGDTYIIITWTTDENATSRIDYGTESGSYTDYVSSTNLVTSHSLTLTDLTAETTYYYQLTSADKNSNTMTESEYTFTTTQTLYEEDEVEEQVEQAEEQAVEEDRTTRGGGGVLIIDSSDKVPPTITDVAISNIRSDSAIVSWKTDEEANSAVEYSEDASYSLSDVKLNNYTTDHSVAITRLSELTAYNYKVASIDKSGNLSYSSPYSFTTLSQTAEELEQAKEELSFEDVMDLTDEKSVSELYQVASDAMSKALDIFSNISSSISLNQMESALGLSKERLESLAKNIPAPLLSGEPRVITTAKTATVAWQTNKDSNSLVAYSPEESYNAQAEDPYLQVVGNVSDRTTQHVVTIHDLEPDTLYHYQVRSQADLGPISQSQDFVFRTDKETLDIKNFIVDIISPEEAIFRWVTNIEGNSQVKYTPYRNNILTAEETRTKEEKAITTIHEVDIKDFESGVTYKIELSSTDLDNITASKEIDFFSTAKDDLPPVISDVKTSSALSTGASTKVQTIIFWKTNELSTGQVFWAEGLIGQNENLTEAVKPDTNYSKEHTAVITKFEPGKIYTFRAESTDSSGNKAISQNFTILAPKQKDSVFQIIMRSLEEAFGWVGNIRK